MTNVKKVDQDKIRVLSKRVHEQWLPIISGYGLEVTSEPTELASGAYSRYLIDGQQALADGQHLRVACEIIISLAEALEIEWNAIGGMTMGADPLAHGVALLSGKHWFAVRKAPKGRGTNKLIEATSMSSDTAVLLIDDVVTTGASIRKAYEAVVEQHATVVLATTLVDRGDVAHRYFESQSIPYFPLITHRDLNIPAINPFS